MEKYIIGIDSGTSGIKAVLFNMSGKEVVGHGYALNAICQKENWYEEDMLEIWDKAKKSIKAITMQYPKESIVGIGITAQGDGLWLIDEKGDPIQNGCCFCDGRAGEFFDEWEKNGTIERVFKISGTRLFTGNQNAIVKWMDKYNPESLEKAKYILHLKDYLFFKLTGEITTDSTDQSLVYLNMETLEYDDRLFREFGLEKYKKKYPPIKSSKDNAAKISSGIANELGLSLDTLVTSGPMDVAACALGSGVIEKAQCCSIIGTAALHEMVIDKPCSDQIVAGMTVTHAVEGKWLRLMASLAGAPNLEWVIDTFGKDLYQTAEKEGLSVYEYIEKLIQQVPIGSRGIIYHPYLLAGGERAPFVNPYARASFTGLSSGHTLADILRACYEGVAYAMLDCYSHMPLSVAKITVCGGGAKSGLWCQMFSDVLGKTIVTVKGEELGAKGAAMNNAVVQGFFKDYEQAVANTVEADSFFEPDLNKTKEYSKFYNLYKHTYEALESSWRIREKALND